MLSDYDDSDGLDYTYPRSASESRPPSAREIAFAIVAVAFVLAMVFIVLRRQSEQARMINCAANLQQIGEAMMLYAQDNDDAFPNRLTGWPASASEWQQQEAYTWRVAIKVYLPHPSVYRCLSNPDNLRPTGCTVSVCGPLQEPDGFTISYACNYVPALTGTGLSRGFCSDKNAVPVALKSIQNPSDLIAVVEDESNWSEFDVIKPAFRNELFTGHNGAGNYLFADGHVAPLYPANTVLRSNYWVNGGAAFTGGEAANAHDVLGLR